LAAAAECQPAYLTRVFGGDAHFNLEQAQGISSFLSHTEDEHHHFMLLVQFARASKVSLKNYFQQQLENHKNKRLVLKERFQVKTGMSFENQVTYYSRWYFAAIHVLVSVPKFQNREALAEHLKLPSKTVAKALEFLTSCGLVQQSGHIYRVGVTRIHLGSDSPLLAKHHMNWRLQAMKTLDNPDEVSGENTRYSSIVSLSSEDANVLRHRITEMIDEFNAVVKDSKDQEARCLCLDFFKI
jgi:uncharacterized protein (TIGR02147 family)